MQMFDELRHDINLRKNKAERLNHEDMGNDALVIPRGNDGRGLNVPKAHPDPATLGRGCGNEWH